MYRLIDDDLIEWKQQVIRKPILLQGAPQTGKTYAVTNLGSKSYKGNFIIIDCAKTEVSERLLSQNKNMGGLLAVAEKFHGERVDFEQTLLVIDNFHYAPSILKEVKEICELRKNLHIILIGTLSQEIEKRYTWISTVYYPLKVFPLCFAEFLTTQKREDLALALSEIGGVDSDQHQEIIAEFENYLKVGGMPEVVVSWIKDADIKKVRELQLKIIDKILSVPPPGFSDLKILKAVILGVAYNGGSPMDYQAISEEVAMSQIKHCIDALEYAGVVYRVNPSTPTSIPEVNFKVKKFKTILVDVGLAQILYGLAVGIEPEELNYTHSYETSLIDQFIGQELLFSLDESVSYWASNVKESTAKVNFLVRDKSSVVKRGVPVIIKNVDIAAQNHSLDMCLGSYPECGGNAFVLSKDPIAKNKDAKIKEIPVYFAMTLGCGN